MDCDITYSTEPAEGKVTFRAANKSAEFHLGGVELIVTLDQAQRIKDGAEAHGLKVCALP